MKASEKVSVNPSVPAPTAEDAQRLAAARGARDEIRQRISAGVAAAAATATASAGTNSRGDFASRRAAAEAYLAARPLGPQPQFAAAPEALVARFVAKAESLASSVARIAQRASAPAAVAAWLQAQGLPLQAVISGDLADLDWAGAGLSVAVRAAADADPVGITGAFCAVAETGTLLLASSPQTPASVSLLPETHIALVPESRLLATMEQAFAQVRAAGDGGLPRALNFISGPSRTGDIEQTIVLGAHGPCRVHIILLGDS